MIVYEVTLSIQTNIYDEFLRWVRTHVTEMLQFEGFTRAELGRVQEHGEEINKKLRIAYYVTSHQQLDHYLRHHAASMRKEGIARFGEAFTASRRIILDIHDINA